MSRLLDKYRESLQEESYPNDKKKLEALFKECEAASSALRKFQISLNALNKRFEIVTSEESRTLTRALDVVVESGKTITTLHSYED